MKRILIIEDDSLFRSMITVLLKRQGYHVIDKEDANRVVELIREMEIDVLITDILMPDKDGLELIKEVKKTHPGVGIIAISGGNRYFMPDLTLNMAKKFGADYVFPKPLPTQEFLNAIATLTGQEKETYSDS